VIEESQRPADFSWYIPMSPAGMPPAHTASSIAIETVLFSHDLTINGHSNCYIFGNGTFMKSDKFVAGGRRWYLRYYPNGCNSDHRGHVTFLLYHDCGADEDKVPEVSYNVSLLGPDGNPLPRFSRNYQVTYDGEPSFGGLINRSELERSACLRDDAFSVRCEFRVPTVVAKTIQPPTEEPPPNSPTPTHVHADVHERLIRVFFDDMPTDVVLEVGDETFPAHKRLLAANSPVLAAHFTGPMRETTAPSVRIHDMEPRVFKAVLDFIYKGNLQLPPVDDDDDEVDMTRHLLAAADRFDLERLKSICAEKLRTHINRSTVATTLLLAQRHLCHALKDACLDFLAPNLKAVLKSDGFENCFGQLMIEYPSVIVELLARVFPSPR
jgi:speckle-type POZ protein